MPKRTFRAVQEAKKSGRSADEPTKSRSRAVECERHPQLGLDVRQLLSRERAELSDDHVLRHRPDDPCRGRLVAIFVNVFDI